MISDTEGSDAYRWKGLNMTEKQLQRLREKEEKARLKLEKELKIVVN